MKEERLDIFDDNGSHVGTASRSETHAKGYWHRTFQCWVFMKEEGADWLLFQKRHPRKDTNPNRYDITAAGHLLAGEGVEDGVRELEEELGLSVRFDELLPFGVIRDTIEQGTVIDREICHVYGFRSDLPLDAYRLQEDEVTGLVRIRLQDCIGLFTGRLNEVEACGLEREERGDMADVRRVLRLNDFVPHGEMYYLHVFQAVQQHLENV